MADDEVEALLAAMTELADRVARLTPEQRRLLERAQQLQPQFEEAQRKLAAESHDPVEEPASERQARAILDFARRR